MIGRMVAHYVIEEKLGEGGWGVVYRGTDTRLHRTVALKFLSKSFTMGEQEQRRFLREARAASSVNHPNVCVVHAIEDIDEEQFIVMEFLEGLTLRKWMTERRASAKRHLLPVRDVLTIILQVAHGLSAAHKKGIVHRDVKPENIMVAPDGLVKIMDFGLAKLTGESKLTRSGAAIGTVAYMSPEQVWGGEIDARTDIYSFGVLLYEMLAGMTPFKSDHAVGIMHAIVYAEPEPLEDAREGIDPALARIVMKCLAKGKDARYQTMEDVIKELAAFEEKGRTIVAPVVKHHPTRVTPRATNGGPLLRSVPLRWAAGVVGLGAAAFAVFRWVAPTDQAVKYPPPTGVDTQTVVRQQQAVDSSRSAREESRNLTRGSQQDTTALKKSVTEEVKQSRDTIVAGRAKERIEPALKHEEVNLRLFTNKGENNPLFVDGEEMRFEISVDKPCRVRCFFLSADGRCYVLTGENDLHVETGQEGKRIPLRVYYCGSPYGSEVLHVFATTRTFGAIRTKIVERLCVLDESLSAALASTRGLAASGTRISVVERRVKITTAAK
jgi:serine/threonine protein kinase